MNNYVVKNYDKSGVKIYEYDVLRVITTLLVIISHCGYYNIITNYGGIRYGELVNINKYNIFIYIIFSHIVKFIYTFHMPLFIALSGALFNIQIKNNKFSNHKELINNKFKRLIIPFFIVTLIYSVPIKLISGYFNDSKNLAKDIIVGQLLIQGNTYLWFLPTLFLCFITIYFLENKKYIKNKWILFFILNIVSYCIPIKIIRYLFQNIIWFYLGFVFEGNRKSFNNKFKKNKNLCILILISSILLFVLKLINPFDQYFLFKIIDKILIVIQALFGCIFIYLISLNLSQLKIYKNYIYKEISDTSFGLYLYSDPLNYLVLFVIYETIGENIFTTEIGSIFIISLRMIITFTFAFIITKVLQKLKLKYIV